jgi:O-antigen/teichoic acid export membrane protein
VAGSLTSSESAPPQVRRRADPLFRSGYALVLSTIVTSGLGVAYWVFAARLYPPRELGEASAAISAMLMLSNFAQMNLFHGLTRFIPGAGAVTGRLVLWAYVASGAVALVLTTLFVVIAPRISDRLTFLAGGVLAGAGFVAAVVLWGVFALQDGVLTALRRATWVPVENALFGVVKLALLVGLAGVLAHGGIFASWNLPVLLAVIPVNLLIFRRLLARRSGDGPMLRPQHVVRFVAVDYVGALLLQTYTTALPLLIVALLGADANATFYVAYVIVAALDLLAVNLSTSMVVEAAHDEARLGEYTRRVLTHAAVLLVPAVAFLVAAAPQLGLVFGERYADETPAVLQLLALGSLPRMLTIVYMSAMRVERRVGNIVGVQAATSVVIIGLTLLLAPTVGVTGVALAWACGHTAVALTRLPWLFSVLRGARREAA